MRKHGYPTGFKLDETSKGFLTKEEIENEGWVQSQKSPNDMLFWFEKKSDDFHHWRLKYYQHSTYLAPISIQRFIKCEDMVLDCFDRYSDKFEFQCYSLDDFKKLCELLVI